MSCLLHALNTHYDVYIGAELDSFGTNTLTCTLVLASTDLLFPFSAHFKCSRNFGAKEAELVNLIKLKNGPLVKHESSYRIRDIGGFLKRRLSSSLLRNTTRQS